MIKKIQYFTNNTFLDSKSMDYSPVFNPSTGEKIALAPNMILEEVKNVIDNAHRAYPEWCNTPVTRRVEILHRVRHLIDMNMEELSLLVAREHGKIYAEAKGDVIKAREATELAISTPILMQGDALMNTSRRYDTVMYREPLGVFAAISPFNFPAMIPMGWMVPNCIATGNTIVLKVSEATPLTAMKMAELYREAGLPDGVLNIITCAPDKAQELLENPIIKGVTFVGSYKVGKYIYSQGALHGKRVQALCEAKNHALVLEDAVLDRVARGIVNAAYGCAGERCMAVPVVVAQESIADELVEKISNLASQLIIGPAYDKTSELGPVYSAKHKEHVLNKIQVGIDEGARLVLDGRNATVEGYENGFYMGPTIFDNVTENMTIGKYEIFGPVLCIKRVKDFEEGLTLMNNNPFANGAIIYTQSGYYAREFAARTHGGMVGVNVGIPVPISIFAFSGHKRSFLGDLHCLGKDAYRFYTESKSVTTHWFNDTEPKTTKVSTWDGTI